MKVLLIGDSCEDRYFYGEVKRLNPEAPVPILEYKRGVTSKGMVWNVRENLRSFGVEVYLSTHPEEIIKTRYIDVVLTFGDRPELEGLIQLYSPDILLLGDDWRYGDVVGREYAKEVRFLPRVGGYASSNTIKRIHNL